MERLGADEHSIMGGEIGIMYVAMVTSQHSALQTHALSLENSIILIGA